MSLALVDCPTGLAGNMLLAALFDLGLPQSVVEAPLAALGLTDRYRLVVREQRRCGFRGLHLEVESLEREPPHRHWGELRQRFERADWPLSLRDRVLAVFGLLAEAEAQVHGTAPEQVHFHEVGAIDAIADIVGVCAGLLHFEVEQLICAPPPAGHGRVNTAHGPLPLPAPAVLEIARRRQVPLASSAGFAPGELTTPTGLALMACWAERFGPAPTLLPLRTGVGLGSRELDRPNLLRLTLAAPWPGHDLANLEAPEQGQHAEEAEPLLLQQAQIDDATAEDVAFLAEALRQAGAVEVFSQPILMKKGRQGTMVTALLPPGLAPSLREVWWRHSTTLGLREQPQHRWRLPRQIETWSSELGEIRLKRTQLPGGGERLKAEHDDLVDLARRHNLSLEEVRDRLRGRIGST
ncbi:MAG: LarC family nickel insertion protein [Synechococcaceae cyanobacterium]|nr:LarC family nickel insertion protein [Synechococcaceae cyanobacterium]